jgi:tetratricopeptide (TPR) repeat protein
MNHKEEGDKQYRDKHYSEAVDCYKKALSHGEIDPHKIYSNRCACYLQLGHYNLALDDANTCTRLRPSWAKGYLRTGSVLVRLGRNDEAINAFKEVLRLENDNIEARETLKRLELARNQRRTSSDHNQSGAESDQTTNSGFNMNDVLMKVKMYLMHASLRVTQWWASLDSNMKMYMLLGGVGIMIYYFFFSRPSYYDFNDGYTVTNTGLSWTTWGVLMFAAYKAPPMFPDILGQYAQPFFGMQMGTFMWLISMLTNNGGRRSGFNSMFGNRYGGMGGNRNRGRY